MIGENLRNPKECDHDWKPVSFVMETQLLDSNGGVVVRMPDMDRGQVYCVCMLCAQHTYILTNWVGYQLEGTDHRGFHYRTNSSHSYSVDGETWQEEKPGFVDTNSVPLGSYESAKRSAAANSDDDQG